MEKDISYYELVCTDGVFGDKKTFGTKEAAYKQMKQSFDELIDKRDIYRSNRSYINDSEAVLYLRGRTFMFKIYPIYKDCLD